MMEDSKNVVNRLVKTSATLAVLGAAAFNGLVQANELAPSEPLVAPEANSVAEAGSAAELQTVPEAQAQVAIAQTDVAAATDSLNQASAAVAEQEGLVVTAQAALDTAATAVASVQATVDEAAAIPAALAQTEAEATAKSSELAQAQEAVAAANQAVDAQQTSLADRQAAVDKAQSDVAAAESLVSSLEATPTRATLEAEKAAAQAERERLTASLAAAEAELQTATANASSSLAADVAAKSAEIARLEAEIARLANETRTVTTEGISDEIMGGNSIHVPTYYANQLNTIRNYTRLSAAERQNLIDLGIRAAQENGFDYTTYTDTRYKSIARDLTRFVDLSNAAEMTAVQEELSLFAAGLLNPVRSSFGLDPVKVTSSSLEFARAVAANYAAKHTHFNHDLGGDAHDEQAVNAAAASVGLSTTNTWFENVGSNSSSRNLVSVDHLKNAIHMQLLYMLFTDASANFAHTYTFLKSDETAETYMGVQINNMGFIASGTSYPGFTQFYEVATGGEIISPSFNRTPVAASTSTTTVKVDNTAQISSLRQQVTGLSGEVATLTAYQADLSSYPALAAVQDKVKQAAAQLEAVKTSLTNLEAQALQANLSNAAQAAQLQAAKDALATAQAAQAAAAQELAAEAARLDVLSAQATRGAASAGRLAEELRLLEERLAQYRSATSLADAQAALALAQVNHARAQENLTTQLQELASLKQTESLARVVLSDRQAALAAAQEVLTQVTEEFQGLLVTRDENGLVAVTDTAPLADEQPVADVTALEQEFQGLTVIATDQGLVAIPNEAPLADEKPVADVTALEQEFQGLTVTATEQGLVAIPNEAPLADEKPVGHLPTVALSVQAKEQGGHVLTPVAESGRVSQTVAGYQAPVAPTPGLPAGVSLPNTGEVAAPLVSLVGAATLGLAGLLGRKRQDD